MIGERRSLLVVACCAQLALGCGSDADAGSAMKNPGSTDGTEPAAEVCVSEWPCTLDADCTASMRCNKALDPPRCQRLGCAGEGEPCDPAHDAALCNDGLACAVAESPVCVDCSKTPCVVVDPPPKPCQPSCGRSACGDDGCGGACGVCEPTEICASGACCAPDCQDKECGFDGCGGLCGVCDEPGACIDGGCCTPQCAPGQCGDDGCTGSCGGCAAGSECIDGSCCTPTCEPGQCGADGCGGLCEACPAGSECIDGECCAPDCSQASCGADGCGGVCGECTDGELCVEGACEPAGSD